MVSRSQEGFDASSIPTAMPCPGRQPLKRNVCAAPKMARRTMVVVVQASHLLAISECCSHRVAVCQGRPCRSGGPRRARAEGAWEGHGSGPGSLFRRCSAALQSAKHPLRMNGSLDICKPPTSRCRWLLSAPCHLHTISERNLPQSTFFYVARQCMDHHLSFMPVIYRVAKLFRTALQVPRCHTIIYKTACLTSMVVHHLLVPPGHVSRYSLPRFDRGFNPQRFGPRTSQSLVSFPLGRCYIVFVLSLASQPKNAAAKQPRLHCPSETNHTTVHTHLIRPIISPNSNFSSILVDDLAPAGLDRHYCRWRMSQGTAESHPWWKPSGSSDGRSLLRAQMARNPKWRQPGMLLSPHTYSTQQGSALSPRPPSVQSLIHAKFVLERLVHR